MSYDCLMEIRQNDTEIRRGAPGLYPWREWLDGQTRTIVQGVDFHTDLRAFRNAIYSATHRRGFKSSCSVDWANGTITFRAIRPRKKVIA